MSIQYDDAIFLYPSIWRSIHVCALTIPLTKESKKAFKDFINSLTVLMPDVKSRYSLAIYLEAYNIDKYTDSNKRLFYWTYDLHDFVNQVRIKESQLTSRLLEQPSYSEVLRIYSSNNLNKQFWSTAMWRTIHGLASVYPERGNKNSREAIAYKKMIHSLVYILPCPFCRGHLKTNLKELDVRKYLGGRVKLFSFTYKLHSTVNEQTKDKNITWNEARELYNV